MKKFKVYSKVSITGLDQVHSLHIDADNKETAEIQARTWYAKYQPTWIFIKINNTVEL